MQRRALAVFMAMVVIALTVTVVWAGKIHFVGRVAFSPGSLIAAGKLGGLDNQDVTVILEARGVPTVICRNGDDDEVLAPNPPVVTATGSQFLDHDNYVKHKSPFHVETNDPTLTPAEAGCPVNDDDDRHASSTAQRAGGDDDDDDDDWTAEIVSVKWDQAVITVKDSDTDEQLLNKGFKCKTTETKVRCKPKPVDDDDDDD